MKAVLIRDEKGPAENLYIGEVPTPSPGKMQALVKVKAFGLNRMDILQRWGRYPPPPGSSHILGVEFSGIIESIGEELTSKFKVGDEVIGLVGGGAYAEYVVCSEGNLLHKPDHLTWAEGASIPETYLTAFQSLVLIAGFKENENALIHAGASGVGIAATQIARLNKGRSIIVTASSDQKLKDLLEHKSGPTHGINYKTQDFAEETLKITNSKGVHVIIDFVGADYLTRNLKSLAIDGRMTLVGLLSGGELKNFDMSPILSKRLKIEGTSLRSRSPQYQADLISRFAEKILPSITAHEGEGPLHTIIHKVFSWKDITKAHLEMESNANTGKIVVKIP